MQRVLENFYGDRGAGPYGKLPFLSMFRYCLQLTRGHSNCELMHAAAFAFLGLCRGQGRNITPDKHRHHREEHRPRHCPCPIKGYFHQSLIALSQIRPHHETSISCLGRTTEGGLQLL